MAISAMYYIENQKIEVVSTLSGKEKILLNGRTVSEKTSNKEASHTFTIGNNEYSISQQAKSAIKSEGIFDVRKNGASVSIMNIQPKVSTQLFVLVIVMAIGFGYILGLLFENIF